MPMRLVRNPTMRALTVSAVAASLAIVALCIVLVLRVNQTQQFRAQVAMNCKSLEAIKDQIRGVFNDNKTAIEGRTDISPSQRTAILAYYDRQLKRFAPQSCPSP